MRRGQYRCRIAGGGALHSETENRPVAFTLIAGQYNSFHRQFAPQPGLSGDILPIALHMTKLALLELLDGQSPAFAPLAADLVAPIHQWINRREFAHSNLTPLGITVDEQTILRWYGVLLHPLEDCAACGTRDRVSDEDDIFTEREPA
ncbi:hypothetical protein ACWCW7_10370 [Nocardia tengchongensis]